MKCSNFNAYTTFFQNLEPRVDVGQFSSEEIGATLNYFGFHYTWSKLIDHSLATLCEPLNNLPF